MSFINDLKQWEAYELKVAEAIYKQFGIRMGKNPEKKGIDLMHPIMNLEVKKDRGVNRTGNYFFEYKNNGKPWWLFAYEELQERATFFWIWNDDEFLLFYLPYLKHLFYNWIEDWKYRVIENAWDGWRVSGILVPEADLKELALYTIKLNENEEAINKECVHSYLGRKTELIIY